MNALIKLCTIMLLALSTNVWAQKEDQLIETKTLIKACNSPKFSQDFGGCLGYFAGIISAAIPATIAAASLVDEKNETAYMKAANATGKVFGCGENDTIINSIEKYKNFINQNPSLNDVPASISVSKMLSSTYPCR